MKKTLIQKCIVSSLLIVCIICATLLLIAPNVNTQYSEGPDIHYYYNNSQGLVTEAASSSEFVEAVEPNQNVDSVYVLDYAPYDKPLIDYFDYSLTKDDVDKIREDMRAEAKAYYSKKNQEFLSSLGVDKQSSDYDVVVSDYSPYVQISYDDVSAFSNYEDEFISDMKSNSAIKEIHVTVPMELEENATVTNSVVDYNMEDILKDIGADDQTYTGMGQNIGIMEAGGIADETSHQELENLDIYTAGDSSTKDLHAEYVTRILCGANGVARGVSFAYIYHTDYESSFIPAMNWFIENNCYVVNLSLVFKSHAGNYMWNCAFFDYNVRYNRCIIINSAGNEGAKSNHMVTPPATGYNIITVANSTKDGNIHESSSYGFNNELKINKPTLAAPGTGIVLGAQNLGSGTSYSAPVVSGVIIKLLEENPMLQLFPEVISAILIASATNANGQNDKWDERAGAGIVNYQRARTVAKNSCRVFMNNNKTAKDGLVVCEEDNITVNRNDKIRAVAIWSANSQTKNWGDSVQTNIHTNYDTYLKFSAMSSGGKIKYGQQTTNMEFFVYKVLLSSPINFVVHQKGNRISSDDDYGAMAWYIE